MLSLYRAGQSPIHRLGAGVKLLSVLVWIAAISFWGANLVVMYVGLLGALVLFQVAFRDPALYFRSLWSLRAVILISFLPQLVFAGWQLATINTGRLVAGVLVAMLFTMTTPHALIIAAIERAAAPMARLGFKPQTIGLAISLTLRAIPMLLQFSQNIMEAQRARGLEPSAVSATVPILVASLKYADDMSEALAARGVEA